MAYDDIIVATGGFGRYQRRVFGLLCLTMIPYAFQLMGGVFLAAGTDFRCLLPHENPNNATYQLSSNLTSVFHPEKYEDDGWSQCERYGFNLTDQLNDSDGNLSLTTSTLKCDSFVYDKTTYELTTATEFNLVCDDAWLRATADSLFMVGFMLGSTIFGGLSDIYGRKTSFCLALCLQTISGLLIAVSPEIISYMIFRMLAALGASGVFQLSMIMGYEMVVPNQRSLVELSSQLVYLVGYVLTPCIAYFITNWRMLQIAFTVPNFAFIIYWWLLPESIRWLISKDRLEEAKCLIQKASVENCVELSPDTLDSMLSESCVSKSDHQKYTIIDLWRHPSLRRKTLILVFDNFVITSTYFALSWNTSSLAGNDYINFGLSGLVEVPALAGLLLLNVWGRKKSLCGGMLFAGIFLLLTIVVPDDISWLNVTLTMLGKMATASATVTAHVFAAELYPTVIRNTGVGASIASGGIGGIVSPYFIYSSVIWKPLPIIVLGSGSVIGGLLVLLLPETLGRKLPESIEDGEEFAKESVHPLDNISRN